MINKGAMKLGLFLALIVCISASAIAQDSLGSITETVQIQVPVIPIEDRDRGAEPEGYEPFVILDNLPEFPGGEAAMSKYIAEHITYPAKARRRNIQGRVVVQFIVTQSGSVENVKVFNDADPLLAKAAIKVIEGMPKWISSKRRGEPVAVRMSVPITFKLQN